MKTQIIDNALDPKEFKDIQHALLSNTFPWFWNDSIARNTLSPTELKALKHHEFGAQIIKARDEDNYYFTNGITSETLKIWPFFQPLLRSVIQKDNKLIRVKANLYLRTDEIEHHDTHVDYDFENNAAILYINTNNGLTVLEDGTEIESVANRLLFFDGSKPHHSTTCTDQKRRVNININYV
jgi:hypothetical protein